jgi:hypothetical protein
MLDPPTRLLTSGTCGRVGSRPGAAGSGVRSLSGPPLVLATTWRPSTISPCRCATADLGLSYRTLLVGALLICGSRCLVPGPAFIAVGALQLRR